MIVGSRITPGHVIVNVGLSDDVLEDLRTRLWRGEDCVIMPNGAHLKVILFRGEDDDELARKADEIGGAGAECQSVGQYGLRPKLTLREKLRKFHLAASSGLTAPKQRDSSSDN